MNFNILFLIYKFLDCQTDKLGKLLRLNPNKERKSSINQGTNGPKKELISKCHIFSTAFSTVVLYNLPSVNITLLRW